MEAALKKVLKESLGEYVKSGLERTDMSSFPLVLRNLVLNEKKCQQEFDEDGTSAIVLTVGKIGSVKITPGWMGTVDVLANNIELSFSFSPSKAMANAMKGNEDVGGADVQEVAQAAPPPPCPPRFCPKHDTSDKRVKGEPVFRECKSCGVTLQSSYVDFQLCPPCSEKEQRCLICGAHAPKCGTYIPGQVCAPCPPNAPATQASNVPPPQASNVPPPPPPPAQAPFPWTGNPNGKSADSNRQPRGDSFIPADTTRSMQLSRQQSRPTPTPEYSTRINTEAFSTRLPENQRPAGYFGGPEIGQNRLARPRQGHSGNNSNDESLGGFLRYVAADVWGMCNAQQNQRFDSFGGPTPSMYPNGFKRGGA